MTDTQAPCSSYCQPGVSGLKFYQAFIFSIPIVFALVLLLLFYRLYLRRRTALRDSQLESQYQAPRFPSAPSEHGLKKEFRDRLPTIIFSEGALGEDIRCSVCLGDYRVNEELQQLPFCGHAFHMECIDHWLTNNTTCPLCRTSLLQATKVVPLDLAARLATHRSLPASFPRQDHPVEDVPAQQSSATLDTPRR